MTKLYTNNTVICKLKEIFIQYFSEQTKPTVQHLFELVLSILALNGYTSIRSLHKHFVHKISENSLNSYYYVLNESKIDLTDWMEKLISAALSTIPSENSRQPIVLAIDDTMVEKSGKTFECSSHLFDHAAHNGSNYLDGHCFVSLLMNIPITGSKYLAVPIGYRMWDGTQSKLDMAAELVKTAMEQIGKERSVILCCDSWYSKKPICHLIQEYENIDIICNVRSDTVLYHLPPEKTGERGRPRKRGERIDLKQISLTDILDTNYSAGVMPVKTNIFGDKTVNAIVTKTKNGDSFRLFISTQAAENLEFDDKFLHNKAAVAFSQENSKLLPLAIYTLRWNIEVTYYEHKTFWGLGKYMLQKKTGIERLVNLISLIFSVLTLLPFQSHDFSALREESPQEIRFILGQFVQQQVFLTTFDTYTKSSYIPRDTQSYLFRAFSSLASVA